MERQENNSFVKNACKSSQAAESKRQKARGGKNMTEAGWRWILHEITTMRIEMPEEPMIAIEAKAWMVI